MFCIYKINKLFDIIPRPKHYKDVINIPFLTFRLKFNYLTIPFHNDAKKHLLGLSLKRTPLLLYLFDNKDCCQKYKRIILLQLTISHIQPVQLDYQF